MCTSVLRRWKRKDDGGDRSGGPGGRNGKTGSCCPLFKNGPEVEILKRLPEVTLIPCEKTFGFTWKMTDEVKQEAADYYKSMFETACREAVKRCGKTEDSRSRKIQNNETCDVLLVLDEVCASLSSGLLELVDIVDFLDHRPAGLEVVMTGRKPPEELLLRADYVTEMEKIKHPFDRKILARRGIEY